jgi:hypothetical protein
MTTALYIACTVLLFLGSAVSFYYSRDYAGWSTLITGLVSCLKAIESARHPKPKDIIVRVVKRNREFYLEVENPNEDFDVNDVSIVFHQREGTECPFYTAEIKDGFIQIGTILASEKASKFMPMTTECDLDFDFTWSWKSKSGKLVSKRALIGLSRE